MVPGGDDALLDLLEALSDERVSRGLQKMLRLVAVLEENGLLDLLLALAENPGALEALLKLALAAGDELMAPATRLRLGRGGP